jgi:quercetin dioxygenase-like cupin family protein
MHLSSSSPPAVSVADTNLCNKPMTGQWSTTDLLQFNGIRVRQSLMQDAEAHWHTHQASDELFLILSGQVKVDVRSGVNAGDVTTHLLAPGQMIAIHAGTEHRASCDGRASLIVMDAAARAL